MADTNLSSSSDETKFPHMFSGIFMQSSGLDHFLKIAIVILTVSVVLYVGLTAVADPDLWGHVRSGQDMLRVGKVITTNPYSYLTTDFFWTNQEWLSEVLIGLSYNLAGTVGLVVLKGAVISSLILLILKVLRSSGWRLASGSFLLFVALILMSPGVSSVRSQLFTYLFFAVNCVLIRLAGSGRRKWLWLMPFVMVLWANCHGGFLAGLALMLLWTALTTVNFLISALKTPRDKIKPEHLKPVLLIWTICILSFLATLINPFGIKLLTVLLVYMRTSRLEISEWNPLSIVTPLGGLYLLWVTVILVSLIYSKKQKNMATMVVIYGMQIAPLVAVRHLPLSAISSIVLASDHLESCWQQLSNKLGLKTIAHFSNRGKAMLTGSAFLGAGIVFYATIANFGILRAVDELPVQAIDILSEIKGKANIVNYFDWGEYIIWRLGPRMKISIDGIRDFAYSRKIYLENMAFLNGVSPWSPLLDGYPTDLVLIPKSFPCYSLLKLKPGWQSVYEDDFSALFARSNSALAQEIQLVVATKSFSAEKQPFFK